MLVKSVRVVFPICPLFSPKPPSPLHFLIYMFTLKGGGEGEGGKQHLSISDRHTTSLSSPATGEGVQHHRLLNQQCACVREMEGDGDTPEQAKECCMAKMSKFLTLWELP